MRNSLPGLNGLGDRWLQIAVVIAFVTTSVFPCFALGQERTPTGPERTAIFHEVAADESQVAMSERLAEESRRLHALIGEVIPQLTSDSPQMRDAARTALHAFQYMPDSLVRMALTSPEASDRVHAMRVVNGFRTHEATAVCIAALGDSDGDVVAAGIAGIRNGNEYSPSATYGLMRLLGSTLYRTHRVSAHLTLSKPVASDAALALGESGTRATVAVPLLESLAENPAKASHSMCEVDRKFISASSAVALINIENSDLGERVLRGLLRDASWEVREWAIYSILDVSHGAEVFSEDLAVISRADPSELVSGAAEEVRMEILKRSDEDSLTEER